MIKEEVSMFRECKDVYYSYEHGDKSLPKLKEMVSDTADPEKETIIKYLRTNCIAGCPGVVYDEITPGNVIGSGNLYSDGTYLWNDALTNYVELYNIPLPKEFRTHILRNHSARAQRHALLSCVDKLEIENTPYLGYHFHLILHRNGSILYQNNVDHSELTLVQIDAEKAAYIIDPVMSDLFCYDFCSHGSPTIDGYHWKLSFYKGEQILDNIEGWPNEYPWRYETIRSNLEFIERHIPFKLGYDYMPSLSDDMREKHGQRGIFGRCCTRIP